MSEIRVLPLPKVKGYWEHDCSRYPDIVKIPMSDGTVAKYVLQTDQPHPQCLKAIESIGRMVVGYAKK